MSNKYQRIDVSELVGKIEKKNQDSTQESVVIAPNNGTFPAPVNNVNVNNVNVNNVNVNNVNVNNFNVKTKSFPCPECEYITTTKVYLKKHIEAVHLKIKEYGCSLCDYRAFAKYGMQRHEQSVHKLFWCFKCGLNFPSVENFNVHCEAQHPRNSTPKSVFPPNKDNVKMLPTSVVHRDTQGKGQFVGEFRFQNGQGSFQMTNFVCDFCDSESCIERVACL